MKIIHCSDLHLDSPLRTHLTYEKARERNGEILHTFGRLVDYAKENQVRAILIAGDLFDGKRCQLKTADYVLDTIKNAPGILFFYVTGNHDEATLAFSGRSFPSNLVVFKDRFETFTFENVTITGISPVHFQRKLYEDLHLPEDRLNILMMHGQTGTLCAEETVCLPLLKGKHISYLALGHLHRYEQNTLEPGCSYCYPGCLEGRGFDECGEKGFVLLETDDYGIHTRFVPFALRNLYEVNVDVTGLKTVTEFTRALSEAGNDIPKKDMVRFVLQGKVTVDAQKDTAFIKRSLQDRYALVEIKDSTSLLIEEADYAYDISLKGAFYRSVLRSEESDEAKEAILRFGMAALNGEDIL